MKINKLPTLEARVEALEQRLAAVMDADLERAKRDPKWADPNQPRDDVFALQAWVNARIGEELSKLSKPQQPQTVKSAPLNEDGTLLVGSKPQQPQTAAGVAEEYQRLVDWTMQGKTSFQDLVIRVTRDMQVLKQKLSEPQEPQTAPKAVIGPKLTKAIDCLKEARDETQSAAHREMCVNSALFILGGIMEIWSKAQSVGGQSS